MLLLLYKDDNTMAKTEIHPQNNFMIGMLP